MPSIDERVVEMRFDNKEFESGVGVSLDTLEKLKEALKLEGASKGLDSLSKDVSHFSLKGISDQIEELAKHFSAFGLIKDQVLREVGTAVYGVETQLVNLVKSMSTDQITQGFDKYERKSKAVQVMMNATGESIETVSAALEKLNWYTDETSYSYTGMVDNIGKFTGAGIDLDTAITSMIGIANAAGLAGSSTSDATHAMEGFSKAMALGYMSNINWNWIRTAKMDTMQFKTILIEAAESIGTLKRSGDGLWKTLEGNEVSASNFTEALKDGWLNVKVMNAALAEFGGTTESVYQEYLRTGDLTSDIIARMAIAADDLGLKAFKASQEARTFTDAIESVKDAVSTGWMMSFEYIFGNYEEAVSLWTNVANELWDVFNGGAEARNTMLRDWHEGIDGVSGYALAIEALGNIWSGFTSILNAVRDAWKSVFPDMTAERLIEITETIRDMSEEFAGAWHYVEDAGDAIDAFIRPFNRNSSAISDTASTVAVTSAELDELARRVISGEFGNGEERRSALEALGYSYAQVQNRVNELLGVDYRLEEATDGVTEAMNEAADAGENAREQSSGIFKKPGEEAEKSSSNIENLQKIIRGVASAIKIVRDATSVFFSNVLGPLVSLTGRLFSPLLTFLGNVGEKITDASNTWLSKETLLDMFDEEYANRVAALGDKISDFFTSIKDLGAVQKLRQTFQKLKDTFASKKATFIESLTGFFNNTKLQLPTMEQLLSVVDWIADKAQKLVAIVTPLGGWLLDKLNSGLARLQKFKFSSITTWASNRLVDIKDLIEQVKTRGIGQLPTIFKEKLDEIKPRVKTAFSNLRKFFNEPVATIRQSMMDAYNEAIENGDYETAGKMKESMAKLDAFLANINAISAAGNGSFLRGIWETTKEWISGIDIPGLLRTFWANTKTKLKDFVSGIDFKGFFEGIKTKIQEALSRINPSELISNIIDKIQEKLASIKEKLSNFFSGISEKMSSGASKIGGVFSKVWTFISNLMAKIPTSKLLFFGFAVGILSLILTIRKVVSKVAPLLISVTSLISNVGSVVTAFASVVSGFSGVGGAIGTSIQNGLGAWFNKDGVLAQIAENKFVKKPNIVHIILAIALAIGVLAGSLYFLSTVDPNALLNAGKVLIATMAAFTGMAAILMILSRVLKVASFNFMPMAVGILALAGAFALIAGALWLLSQVELNADLGKKVFVVAGILAVIGLAAIALSKVKFANNPMNIASAVAFVVSMSLAMIAAVVALRMLANLDLSKVQGNLGALAIVLVAMIGLSVVAKNAKFSGAVGIAVLALDLLLLVHVLEKLSEINPQTLIKSLPQFIILFGLIVALMAATNLAGKNAGKAGWGLLGISVSILVLARAIKSIGELDPGAAKRGLASVTVIMAMYGFLLRQLNEQTGKYGRRAGAMFLAMAASILLLSVAIKYLGSMDPADAIQGALIVDSILLIFGYILKGMPNVKGAALGILAMSLVIATLVGAIWFLSTLDYKTALVSAGSLSAVLLSLGVAFHALSTGGLFKAGKLLANAVIMGIILAAVVGALYVLSRFTDSKGILEKAGALSMIVLAIAGAIRILGTLPKGSSKSIWAGIGGFVGLIAAITVIVAVLGLLMNIEGAATIATKGAWMLTFLGLLGPIFAEFAVLQLVLSAAGRIGGLQGTGAGIFGFIGLITGITLICGLLGGLATNPKIVSAIESGGKILTGIGTLIGEFFGNIIGGFVTGATGGTLGPLADDIVAFVSAFEGIDATTVTGATNAALAISGLASNMPRQGGWMQKIFGEKMSLDTFGSDLITLGSGIAGFADAIGDDFDADSISASVNAAKTLAGLYDNLPRHGGSIETIIGTKDMTSFGTDLLALAGGLKMYSMIITSGSYFNADAVTASANAATILASIYDSLPSTGGTLQDFLGEADMTTFATDLPELAKGLKGYSDAITADGGIDETAVTSSANALSILAGIANDIPASNGKLQEWFGDKSLGTFGSDLKGLGSGLKGYSDAITEGTGIDSTAVEASANLLSMIVALNNDLPAIDGVLQWFTGEKDLGTFGDNLAQLGEGIVAFSDSTSSLGDSEYVSLYRAVGIVSSIVGISQALADATAETGNINFLGDVASLLDTMGINIGSLWTNIESIDFTQTDSLLAFLGSFNDAEFISEAPDLTATQTTVESLVNVAKKVKSNYDKIKDVSNWESMTSFIEFITSVSELVTSASFPTSEVDTSYLQSALDGIANVSVDSFSQTFTDGTSTVTDAINNLLSAAADAIQSGNTREFYQAGYNLIQQIANGMRSYGGLTSIARSVASTISTTIRNNINGYSIGTNAMAGFINGMNAKAPEVYDTARRIANNVSTTMKKALDERSPSRVTYGIGRFVSEGLSLGISDYGTMVERSAENVSEAAVDQMRNAIQTVSDIVNGIVELDPTIRPVLDLSNIQNGAQAINSLLGLNTTQFNLDSLAANAASINGAFRAQSAAAVVTQTSQQDVVSAIRGIRSDINELGERITSMQLVLDSGTLVGEIMDPIDQELGRRQLYAERGV